MAAWHAVGSRYRHHRLRKFQRLACRFELCFAKSLDRVGFDDIGLTAAGTIDARRKLGLDDAAGN